MTLPIKPSNSNLNDEQWEAIHTRGNNLLLAASAGSGKTMVLIERILAHIQERYAGMDQLLIVTFTKAAAREMKSRMELRLKEAINQAPSPEERRYYLSQLNLIPEAHIQTIDSFCLQIVKQYFYEIDFDPSFELETDESQLYMINEEAWEMLLEDIYEGRIDKVQAATYEKLLSLYGNPRSDVQLFELVIQIYRYAMVNPNPKQWLLQAHDEYKDLSHLSESPLFKEVLLPYFKSMLQMALGTLASVEKGLMGAAEDTQEKYGTLISAEMMQAHTLLMSIDQISMEELLSLLGDIDFGSWPRNSKKDHDDYALIHELKKGRDEAKEQVTKVAEFFYYDFATQEKIEKLANQQLLDLCYLVEAFMDRVKRYKQSIKIVTYNDIEHLTLDILAPMDEKGQRKASHVASYYQEVFHEVLIDEYQDINEIQAAILYYVSRQNNMFMVGDVKQSIYGFRMAEPKLFMEKYSKYQNKIDGQLIVLNQNYRSRFEILEFTNYLFERIMDPAFGDMPYEQQEALVTGFPHYVEDQQNKKYSVEILLNESGKEDEEGASSGLQFDKKLEVEAYLIAQDIHNRIQKEELLYDKKLGHERPIEPRDFVVLASTHQAFLPLQRALSAYGLPVLSQKNENYFQRYEVQIMVALLQLLDNPMQDIPLVAVLRSYFVNCSDNELAKIRVHCPQGDFYQAVLTYAYSKERLDIDLQEKLQRFLHQLDTWRALSQESSLVTLLWQIYEETDFLNYVSGLSNGQQRQSNLHALYERAEAYTQQTSRGLATFLRYIQHVLSKDKDLAEPVIISENENMIRLMTVHASKGLEFPFVYIINTNKGFNLQDAQGSVIMSKDYGLLTDLYLPEHKERYYSAANQILKLDKANELKAEEMRKLYVALTRAEQKVVIVGSIASQEKWLATIEKIRKATPSNERLVQQAYRLSATSWLDWIQQALAVPTTTAESYSHFNLDLLEIRYMNQGDIHLSADTFYSRKQDPTAFYEALKKELEDVYLGQATADIQTLMTYEYPYQLATRTSSYQSVSELKRLYEEPRIEKLSYFGDRRSGKEAAMEEIEEIHSIRYTEESFEGPNFLQKKQLSPTDIGRFTHYFLQELDLSAFKKGELQVTLKKQWETMLEDGTLTLDQGKVIPLDDIGGFLLSDLGQRIIHSNTPLYKEQAFSYLLPAQAMFKEQLSNVQIEHLADEQLLIHGIIDLYYETDEGLVLVDYKTDRYRPYGQMTKNEQLETLLDTYRFQLSLYAQALKTAKNKPIHAAYLVLLDFGEVLEVKELIQF